MLQDDGLFQELDEGLARVTDTYPMARQVIDGYRELFRAFYEVYVSTEPERDVNQDLCFIERLVRNKYILTQLALTLDLDPEVPPLKLEGGMQSIFLELMQSAASRGAERLLARTMLVGAAQEVHLHFYHDGAAIADTEWEELLHHDVGVGQGLGLADARYIVETLNGGRLRREPANLAGYSDLYIIEVQMQGTREKQEIARGGDDGKEAVFPPGFSVGR
jgi:hypothetical protein